MATNESTRGGGIGSALITVVYLLAGLASIGGIFLVIKPYINPAALHDILTIPTARITDSAVTATPFVLPPRDSSGNGGAAQPAVDVNQAIANYNATQTALYPQQNVDALPANAPAVEYGSRPNAIEQSNGIVPTSEPIPTADPNSQFGSKPAVVNPQRDHQCLHGQIWTARGCKNPTPTQ